MKSICSINLANTHFSPKQMLAFKPVGKAKRITLPDLITLINAFYSRFLLVIIEKAAFLITIYFKMQGRVTTVCKQFNFHADLVPHSCIIHSSLPDIVPLTCIIHSPCTDIAPHSCIIHYSCMDLVPTTCIIHYSCTDIVTHTCIRLSPTIFLSKHLNKPLFFP